MARRIIELKWNCGECSTKDILGRHKRCPNCGSPREKGEMKMGGLTTDRDGDGYNDAASVTDPELLKLANAGADWFCSHCGSGNIGNGDSCQSCGAPRYGKAEEDHPEFAGDHKSVKGFDEKLEEEMQGGWAEEQPEYRDPEDTWEPEDNTWEEEPEIVEDWAKKAAVGAGVGAMFAGTGTILMTMGIGFLVFLVIGFTIWALQTHEVPGHVSKTAWSQSTVLQHWTQHTVRRWEDETLTRRERKPVNGSGERAGMTRIGGCSEEWHHDEQYACGTKPEDYECGGYEDKPDTCYKRVACGETCRDNGNGFATCTTKYCDESYSCTKSVYVSKTCTRQVTKYCDRPIYETKCDYRTQEWRTVRTVPASGTGLVTRWPEVQTGPEDRLRFQADYSVFITYNDGKDLTYEHKPARTLTFLGGQTLMTAGQAREAEGLYKQWEPGEEVTVTVNNLGGIREVKHGTETIQAEE